MPTRNLPLRHQPDVVLERIEAYLKRTGISHYTFGTYAVSSPRFVQQLRKWHYGDPERLQKCLDYMRKNPEGPKTKVRKRR